MPIGSECCIDKNINGICDNNEAVVVMTALSNAQLAGFKEEQVKDFPTTTTTSIPKPGKIDRTSVHFERKDGKMLVVYDNEVVNECNGTSPVFWSTIGSPIFVNGKAAYVTDDHGRWYVIYDCKESNAYDLVSDLTEIDGKLAYIAQNTRQEEYFAVYDGVESQRYSFIENFVIRTRLAYVAQKYYKQGWVVVVGDKEVGLYDSISGLSEINGKLRFNAVKNGSRYVIDEE